MLHVLGVMGKMLSFLLFPAGSLLDKLPDLPSNDGNFMVSALTAIVSVSDEEVDSFAVELINVSDIA